jgi:hypothetical protein
VAIVIFATLEQCYHCLGEDTLVKPIESLTELPVPTGFGRNLLADCNPAEEACDRKIQSIIDGGTIVRECVVRQNLTVLSATTLLSGVKNIQPSRTACCSSCFDMAECKAWSYCEQIEGCDLPTQFTSNLINSSVLNGSLPYHGCRLLDFRGSFSNLNESSELVARNVPFVSGRRVELLLPAIPGYMLFPNKDLGGQFNYPCVFSPNAQRCQVFGSVSEISDICNADPRCSGFIFIPAVSGAGEQDFGVLKGGASADIISMEALQPNSLANTYLLTEDGFERNREGNDSESGTNILWIILPTIAGALLLAMLVATVFFAVLLKRHARMVKGHKEQSLPLSGNSPASTSDRNHLNKPPDTGAGPSERPNALTNGSDLEIRTMSSY